MKQLFFLLMLMGLILTVAQNAPKSTNPSQSIFQNMEAIPSITLITASIRAFHKDLYDKLNDPNSEKFTFFVPNDRAVASAAKIVDAMLQRSGYPSLDELKRQAEEKGNKCPPELSGDQCAPWNMDIGITKDQAKAQAEKFEKFPSGYNATDIGWKFGRANAHYHIAVGDHSTSTLPAHCFLQSLLDDKFADFVRLNGGAQVLHVEDVSKGGHSGTNPATVPSDPLQERITPVKILFGVASDPIPQDTLDRLQRNASFIPGLVDNNIASIIIPDIKSANGYVHVIDKVLVLPLNATDTMRAANLTKFAQLIEKAGLKERINQELQNITIFAPSDEALNNFIKDKGIQLNADADFFYPETDADTFALAAQQDNQSLQNLVLHHIVQGSYYPPFVPSSAQLNSLDGKTLQFRQVNPNTVSVDDINTIKHDMLLRNGVLHVLDGVLPIEWGAPSGGGAAPTGGGGTTCPQPGQPVIRPISGSQFSNKTIAPSFVPCPGQQQLPSAKELGCPETDGVCRVIDFDFLQCKTQLQTLNENERKKCDRFQQNLTSHTVFPNRTVCYNRSTHTCVWDSFLCPLTHPELCGVQCYNPNEYRCYATMSLCPANAPNKCGEACYNRENYSCKNGQLVSISQNQQQQQRFDADTWNLKEDVPVHSFNF